MKFSKKQR